LVNKLRLHSFFGLGGHDPMWFGGPVPNSRVLALDGAVGVEAISVSAAAVGEAATAGEGTRACEDVSTDALADEHGKSDEFCQRRQGGK